MQDFTVEQSNITTVGGANLQFGSKRREEVIKQIESLRAFYMDVGKNSENIKTIFSLTLGYLKGKVNKLMVRSFFDTLMNKNKLDSEKEINLLMCFEELLDEFPDAKLQQDLQAYKAA